MSSPTEYSSGFLAEDKQSAVQGTCIVFLVFDTIATALRLIARRTNGVKWGWDDFFAVLGYVLCIAVIGCALGDVHFGGVGLHAARVAEINPKMLVTWAKFVLVIPLLYLAAIVPPKLSILSLYLRIFISRPIRIVCYTVVGFIVANWVAATIAGFLICVPLDHLWNAAGSPNGHCFDINAWFRWSSLMNIITDVVILILPLPTIWKLHCSYRMKLGIFITFLLGGLGLVASIIRFVGFFGTNADADPTWSATSLCIWTVVESGVYLIASCVPTYRPLGRLIWQKTGLSTIFSTRSQENSKRPQGMNGQIMVSYELSQTKNFVRLNGSKAPDDESIGLVP